MSSFPGSLCVAAALFASGDAVTLRPPTDKCACLPWKDVYRNTGAVNSVRPITCGEGAEFSYEITRSGRPWRIVTKDPTGDEVCSQFYKRLPGNACMNANFTITDTDALEQRQWCWVSAGCHFLNGGAVPLEKWKNLTLPEMQTLVGWKYCTACEDELMAEKTVEELQNLQAAADLDLALLVKMSYPTFNNETWAHSKGMLEGTAHFAQERHAVIQRIVDSGKHMAYNSPEFEHVDMANERPWKQVVGLSVGKKAYEVRRAEGAQSRRHPGANSELACVVGC